MGPSRAGLTQGSAHHADTEKPLEKQVRLHPQLPAVGWPWLEKDLSPGLAVGKTHLLLMAESNTHGMFVAPRTRVPSLLFPTPANKVKYRC